jgi:hypothetical protein
MGYGFGSVNYLPARIEGACPTQQPNAGTTRHKEAQAAMCIRRGCQPPSPLLQ